MPKHERAQPEAEHRGGEGPAAEPASQQAAGLLASFPDGFLALDNDWRLTYVNPVAARIISQYAPHYENFHHLTLWEVSPHLVGTATETEFRRVSAERVAVRIEHYSSPLDAWFEVRAFPATEGIAVYFREITEERREKLARAEREQLVALRAEFSAALASSEATSTTLHRCCEALVRHLDAALARVWTLNEAEQLLELQSSAGCYTHLEGPFCRIPLGQFQIGRIAATRRAQVCNSLVADPEISDREWAEREGITAFAGYPLVVEERVVGVVAVFARHPLTENSLAELDSLANGLAQFIDRRRAEEALRQRELYYRTLFNSLDEGLCVIEVLVNERGTPVDYRFLEVNLAFARQTGLQDAAGKRMRELAPEHEDHWFELYGRVAVTGESVRFEQEAKALDHRWFDVFAFRFGEPELRRVALLFTDITARRRAEAEIRKAGEQARSILESITDAFFALSRDWRFTYVNRQAELLLGRTRSDLLGKNIWEEYAPAIGTEFDRAYHQAMEQNVTVTFDAFYPPHDRWYEVHVYPSPEGLSVYFRDTNERRRAEEALRASEERFRAAVGAVSNLLWTNNAQGLMLGEQPGWGGFTGQSYEEYQGYGWARAVHPEDVQATIDAWQRAVTEKQTYHFEHRVRRRDGVWRLFTIRAVPVLAADGTIREWVGVHTDITDQRLAERRQAFLFKLSEALSHVGEPRQITAMAAELLGRHLGVNRVGYGEIDERGEYSTVRYDWTDGAMPSMVGRHRLQDFGPRLMAEYGAGETVRVDDVVSDPRTREVTSAYQELGRIRATIGVPLVKGERWIATLFVHHMEPRRWTDEEAELAREVAERTWSALERARAEEELRHNAERLRLATDAARLGIWSWEIPDNQVTWENEQLYEIFGFSSTAEPSHASRTLTELAHPDDAADFQHALETAVQSHRRFRFLGRFYRADGSLRWIEVTGRVQYGVDDLPVRLVGTVADLSELKWAEEQISQAAEANAKFRTMFEQGMQFAGILSLDGTVMEANRLCLTACGFTRAEVIGKKFWDCGWWNRSPELVEMVHTATRKASRGELFRTESPYFVADGSQCWVDLIIAPVTDVAGRVLFVAATGADITEQKRVEAELRDADRRKDEFLATLAHELRNPLGAINNALQVLKETGSPKPNVVKLRNVIDRQTRHLRRLVDDLLDISRINQGKFKLQREVVDLQPLLEHVVEILQPAIQEHGHRLEIAYPADPVSLNADPTRLEQVLWNLLHNAVKYTHPGGQISISVEVSECRSHDDLAPRDTAPALPHGTHATAVIRIKDNGIGIAPQLLPRVFDVFAQAEQALDRSQGGLGLGLTLVKLLVEMHGGVVEAHSSGPGQGAEFCVRVPALTGGSSPAPATALVAALNAPGLRILVVDDLVDAAETLAELLELWGHEVRLAYDGPSALAALQDTPFDAVLLDIGLPGMNGYEVATQYRSLGLEPRPYLIALTGYGQPEDRRRSAEAGFDHHLLKPVDMDELRQFLASLRRSTTD